MVALTYEFTEPSGILGIEVTNLLGVFRISILVLDTLQRT